jgi:hypothetical protein
VGWAPFGEGALGGTVAMADPAPSENGRPSHGGEEALSANAPTFGGSRQSSVRPWGQLGLREVRPGPVTASLVWSGPMVALQCWDFAPNVRAKDSAAPRKLHGSSTVACSGRSDGANPGRSVSSF